MQNKKSFLVKFTVVAGMIGFFSPSVSIQTKVVSESGLGGIPLVMHVSLFTQAEAKRNGGGARKSAGVKRNKNRNVNKNKNVNKNVNANVNVNKNVNVNVNHNNRRHYGHYHGRPLVAFSTGLVIGTMIAASTLPTTCTVVVANGISYKRCDNAYYQPFYEGDTVVYKVVNSPL